MKTLVIHHHEHTISCAETETLNVEIYINGELHKTVSSANEMLRVIADIKSVLDIIC